MLPNPIRDWLQRQPIATKLKLANLVTSGVVIFLAGGLLLALQVYLAGAALLEQTRTEAAMTAENLSAAMVFGDHQSAFDILASLKAFGDVTEARVTTSDHVLFARYNRAGSAAAATASTPAAKTATTATTTAAAASTPLAMDGYRFTPTRLAVSQPIIFQGRHLGTIEMTAALDAAYRRIAWYVALVTLVMVVCLMLAHIVLARLQKFVTAPLQALASTSEMISRQGDFSIRANVNPSADIGLLASAFNTVLDRIEKRESELQNEIEERKKIEVKLDRMAHFDNVTGLHNRHFFNDRLATVVAQAQKMQQRAVVMFIDLDNFKTVNDTLGHHTGDELLRIVALRLSSCVRFGDTISRIGGDEFAIILENIADARAGEGVAEKCLAALSEVMRINGNEIYVSASIGISSSPDDAVDVHALLEYADTAMYYAKNAGKNTYRVFAAGMQGEALKRFAMDGNLRRALERDEFVLHYQPQIDLRTGRISGVEALIRWQHPEMGMISPLEFIPIAEETGLIIPIGNWVLKTACEQLKLWHDDGQTHLRMSVNISGRQLREDSFVQVILDIIRGTGVDPAALELELTESMLMDAGQPTIDKLDALRAAGLMLAIDDFGTGYSSMSYLKRFPINTLKVDRSFVRDLPSNTQDVAITKAIISMAHSLALHVVAEGIETGSQQSVLIENGCNSGQGFLYSRPVTAQQIAGLLLSEQVLGPDATVAAMQGDTPALGANLVTTPA